MFTAFGNIAQVEPHSIDDGGNNAAKIVSLAIDFKPFSDPYHRSNLQARRGDRR